MENLRSKMERKLRLSFLETDFFKGSIDGKSIAGHEQVKVNIGGKIIEARMIDAQRLKEAESIETDYFKTEVNLGRVDLIQLLNSNADSRQWLEKFKKYWEYYGKGIENFNLSFEEIEFPAKNSYTLYPPDFCRRATYYKPPTARILRVPEVKYVKVSPEIMFSDGKKLEYLSSKRKVKVRRSEEFWEYSLTNIRHICEEWSHLPGQLFGVLNESDIEKIDGDFRGVFPLVHLYDIVFCVGLRDLNEVNPLSISIKVGGD